MPKFRKKPVVIEAEQFFPNKKPWPDGVEERLMEHFMGRRVVSAEGPPVGGLTRYVIETLEGDYIVSPGDWIITGVKGEKYPCKPDIFEQTYEKVSDDML